MTMKKVLIGVTTGASSGAGNTDSGDIFGKLYSILYIPGNIATGATITITCKNGAPGATPFTQTLLVKASAGTANVMFYPRELVNATADGAALTGTSGGDRACPLVAGRINFAVASGDNSKTGYVVIYYED